MEFSRQEYCSGLPFPSPGILPDPGIKPGSPTLLADSLPSEPPRKLKNLASVSCSVMSCVIPWTVECQAPLSMDFPWTLGIIGMGCHFLLQGIFSTQGMNQCLLCQLHWGWILYRLSHLGSPCNSFVQKWNRKWDITSERKLRTQIYLKRHLGNILESD